MRRSGTVAGQAHFLEEGVGTIVEVEAFPQVAKPVVSSDHRHSAAGESVVSEGTHLVVACSTGVPKCTNSERKRAAIL